MKTVSRVKHVNTTYGDEIMNVWKGDNEKISFRISEYMKQRFFSKCDSLGLNPSEVLRFFVFSFIENKSRKK